MHHTGSTSHAGTVSEIVQRQNGEENVAEKTSSSFLCNLRVFFHFDNFHFC